MLYDYFWSGGAMCVLLWLNTVAVVQMFFIERVFVFFTTFLKKMGIIKNARKPHCHFRLSKPIFKILPIYRKHCLEKQLSQAIYSKYIFRLPHALKFLVFSTKLNMMVNFSQASYEKVILIKFIRKHQWRRLFFNKASCLQAKEILHTCFPASFPKYFGMLFLQNTSGRLRLLNALFVRYVDLSQKKCFPKPWLFWIFSRKTLWFACE